MNEVSGGHTVIFRQIGRNSPDGTNGKQVARALHAAAEFTVKRKFCVRIRAEARHVPLLHNPVGVSAQVVLRDRLPGVRLKKEHRVIWNSQRQRGKSSLGRLQTPLLLGFLGLGRAVNRGNFTALIVQKINFPARQRLLARDGTSPKVGIKLIPYCPLEECKVILEQFICRHIGIHTEKQPGNGRSRLGCVMGGRHRLGTRLMDFVFACFVCISACHNFNLLF